MAEALCEKYSLGLRSLHTAGVVARCAEENQHYADIAFPHDPATHQTNRPGVFVAGTVCDGRATSRWFIENGRHHAQLIAAHLAQAEQG